MTSTPPKARTREGLRSREPSVRSFPGFLALVAALALGAAAPRAAWSAESAAAAVVEKTTSSAIAILVDPSLSTEAKRQRVEDVVLRSIDFETLSRLVLARNWSRFDERQRVEFMELFKNHLSMTYGRNVESYKNEKVQIAGERLENGGDTTVKTKVVRGGNHDILVDYRLRRKDGAWKIIDVVIEGVSLVSNFRSQFQDVVSNGGPERLLALLREKNARGEALKTS
ncbi:MAG: ABC transporter substrate-binding protein [Deltaproteobacteria bacterium]|nr:ABC transporter substrate-binding protein [Deltaproteobacteria bacterium]